MSLWLPPCSWASLAIFQFWVKWFVHMYNLEIVNFHKRAKLIHWVTILSKIIKGLVKVTFLKNLLPKISASVIPLMTAVETAIWIKVERIKENFPAMFVIQLCSFELCHKHMKIKTDYRQYLPPSQAIVWTLIHCNIYFNQCVVSWYSQESSFTLNLNGRLKFCGLLCDAEMLSSLF